MANREMDREKKNPQAGHQQQGGQRKNDEEVGEPIQLDDEKSKGGQQQPNKPPMEPREGEHGGKHQGGGQQGGPRQGGDTANR
jgi:hypothetical protein